jgi:hypothetical protein
MFLSRFIWTMCGEDAGHARERGNGVFAISSACPRRRRIADIGSLRPFVLDNLVDESGRTFAISSWPALSRVSGRGLATTAVRHSSRCCGKRLPMLPAGKGLSYLSVDHKLMVNEQAGSNPKVRLATSWHMARIQSTLRSDSKRVPPFHRTIMTRKAWGSHRARNSDRMKSWCRWARVAWERCIARGTASSIATSH